MSFLNFITRCKFLYLWAALRFWEKEKHWENANEKNMQKNHKSRRIFSGFSQIFMELCKSKEIQISSMASLTLNHHIENITNWNNHQQYNIIITSNDNEQAVSQFCSMCSSDYLKRNMYLFSAHFSLWSNSF